MNAAAANGVGGETLLVTADGYERLRSELETLRAEGRRQMSERLREAREDGHLADTRLSTTCSWSRRSSSGGSQPWRHG